MPTSGQITKAVQNKTNPYEAEKKLWMNARYLVAQKPASASSTVTKSGFYKGCHVVPGPKANPNVSGVLKVQEYDIVKHTYFIRFTDNITTDNAESSIGQAIYTIMDNGQADEYEAELRKLQGVKS